MSGNPSQSQGMGNGIGNMSQLAQAVQSLGMSSGNMGLQSRPPQQGVPQAAFPQQMPPWMGQSQQSPVSLNPAFYAPAAGQSAFTQPASTANSGNTNVTYPQPSGGYYNQMTQTLAGPQYSKPAPTPGANWNTGNFRGINPTNVGIGSLR